MDPIRRIQYAKVLKSIGHTELSENPSTGEVRMVFDFLPERIPAEFGISPNNLRRLTDYITDLVIPEMGQRGKVEWTLDMGLTRLELAFNGEQAELARNAWPSIISAIENLRSQHLRQ